ncbi:MAG: GntR family transcriptional regulator [Bacteroidetes bacterium]|nr:GntR family transcriptional regulator [Bacteroidota bacterium]
MAYLPEGASSTARDGTLKEQLYQTLKADIVNGVFDMGERLNEAQLSAKYGVSRAPLRQALTMLQGDGLVEAVPRVGYLTSRLTLQDVHDIFELRLLLETAMVQKAAISITDDALDRIERLCSTYRPGNHRSYHQHLIENLDFHRTIAEAAGNRRMAQVLTQSMEHMLRLIVLRLDMSKAEDVVHEHLEIAAALRQRDPALARDLLVHHLTVAHQATVEAVMRLTMNRHI